MMEIDIVPVIDMALRICEIFRTCSSSLLSNVHVPTWQRGR
jgi:hypothetical protein